MSESLSLANTIQQRITNRNTFLAGTLSRQSNPNTETNNLVNSAMNETEKDVNMLVREVRKLYSRIRSREARDSSSASTPKKSKQSATYSLDISDVELQQMELHQEDSKNDKNVELSPDHQEDSKNDKNVELSPDNIKAQPPKDDDSENE